MSIDSNSLSYLNQAISNSSFKKDDYKKQNQQYISNKTATISNAAAELSSNSRYKRAFEEKMKLANKSEDTVEISQSSLDALKKYQKDALKKQDSSDASQSSGYTYDYQAIKKKRLENIAKIEADVQSRYGKKSSTVADSSDKQTNSVSSQEKTETVKTEVKTDNKNS